MWEKKVECLGKACCEAFNQTKTVVSHLAETQQELNEDISQCSGVIESSTFMERVKIV